LNSHNSSSKPFISLRNHWGQFSADHFDLIKLCFLHETFYLERRAHLWYLCISQVICFSDQYIRNLILQLAAQKLEDYSPQSGTNW